MWPTQNTAFVVIHGMGEHRPFATVDLFVRGFWEVLKKHNRGLEVQWTHRLQRHKDWIENYISLAPKGKPSLDFYEYYWDCYMVRDITRKDLLKWIGLASTGANKFYKKEGQRKAKQYRKDDIVLFSSGNFEADGYYRMILPVLSKIPILSIFVPMLNSLPRIIGFIKLLARFVSERIINQLGDLVICTNANVRSRNYDIRQRVLSGAVEELKLLLSNNYYHKIIVAGHSLGSVIAYDALNRIVQDMSTEGGIPPDLTARIAGLVTLGSPLDKIAFFFEETTPDENFVQRQILDHFHSYKSIPPGQNESIKIDDPFRHDLDKSVWLNFYHLNDLVSGPLDAYEPDHNITCPHKVEIAEAHSHYWQCDRMYTSIARHFF
jgi:hypothetical protein